MSSKVRARLLYLTYAVASIVLYQLFHEIFGISIWRNAAAALGAALVFLPVAPQLSRVTVVRVVLLTQVAGPILIALVGLGWFVGASLDDILTVLPEIAIYGLVASGLTLVLFFAAAKRSLS